MKIRKKADEIWAEYQRGVSYNTGIGLYDKIGKMSLEDLFCAVEREGFMYLLRSSRPLNIDAVEVWNFYCAERQRDNE